MIYHLTRIIDFYTKIEQAATILNILAIRSIYYEMFYILLIQGVANNDMTYLNDTTEYNYSYYRNKVMEQEAEL